MRLAVLLGMLLMLPILATALDCSAIGKNGTIYSDTVLSDNLFSQGKCLTIGRDNITLDCAGHSITGSGVETGVYVFGRKGVNVINCVLSNFSYGLHVSHSESSFFTENTITGCYIGIMATSSFGLVFQKNSADRNGQGVYAYDLLESTISRGSAKRNSAYGLELRSSYSDKINGNDFSLNRIGIGVYSSSQLEISENDLRGCYSPYNESKSRGISFSSNTQDIVSGSSWDAFTKQARQLMALFLVVAIIAAAVFIIGFGRRKKGGGEGKFKVDEITVEDMKRAQVDR